MSTLEPKPVGRYIPEELASEILTYLWTRPCNETFNLVVRLQNSRALVKEPK